MYLYRRMTLRLTREDAQELRKALETAHGALLRELSGLAGCATSAKAVGLCRRRSRLESLLASLDAPPETVAASEVSEAAAKLVLAA